MHAAIMGSSNDSGITDNSNVVPAPSPRSRFFDDEDGDGNALLTDKALSGRNSKKGQPVKERSRCRLVKWNQVSAASEAAFPLPPLLLLLSETEAAAQCAYWPWWRLCTFAALHPTPLFNRI
jgi:hypothetical protein